MAVSSHLYFTHAVFKSESCLQHIMDTLHYNIDLQGHCLFHFTSTFQQNALTTRLRTMLLHPQHNQFACHEETFLSVLKKLKGSQSHFQSKDKESQSCSIINPATIRLNEDKYTSIVAEHRYMTSVYNPFQTRLLPSTTTSFTLHLPNVYFAEGIVVLYIFLTWFLSALCDKASKYSLIRAHLLPKNPPLHKAIMQVDGSPYAKSQITSSHLLIFIAR